MSDIFNIRAQLQLQKKLSGIGEFDITTESGIQYNIKAIGFDLFREHQDASKELHDALKGLQEKAEANRIIQMSEDDDWKAKLKRGAKRLYETEVLIEEADWVLELRNRADSMKEKNNQSVDQATSRIIKLFSKLSEKRRMQAQSLWDRVLERFKGFWKKAMSLMGDAVDAVISGVRNLWKKISNLFAEIGKEFADIWNWLSALA